MARRKEQAEITAGRVASAQQLAALAKKTCSMADAVTWAFAYLRQEMEPKDAPSLIAWRLWEEGKKDASVLVGMFMDVAKKQAQGDDGAGKAAEWDGKREWDVLKELRASL